MGGWMSTCLLACLLACFSPSLSLSPLSRLGSPTVEQQPTERGLPIVCWMQLVVEGRRRRRDIQYPAAWGVIQAVCDGWRRRRRGSSKVWGVGGERDRGKGGKRERGGCRELFFSPPPPPLSLFLSLSLLLPPCPVAASGGLFQEDADGSSRAKGLG